LIDCSIYGISAWNVVLDGAVQAGLRIVPLNEPAVLVDDLEVAQFMYLLLRNENVRKAIDTITTRVVLILGRFADSRKSVLDAIRDELRLLGFLPVLFDFEPPSTRDTTETILLLAGLARFIIADLTDPRSVPHELATIVPGVAVPVQPLIQAPEKPYAMFRDLAKYRWVLPLVSYEDPREAVALLSDIATWADIRRGEVRLSEARN